MSIFAELKDLQPFESVPGQVRIRRVEGERITLAVVELSPGGVVPTHQHPQEQIGICVTGRITLSIDGEEREMGPGGTWVITHDRPHIATAGPDGAVVVEVFSPTRTDWTFPLLSPQPPAWPAD